MKWVVLFALVTVPLSAQEFSLRDGDVPLSPLRIGETVVGATHTFFDGGRSFFAASGAYSYTYPDGGVARGSYSLREGGVVCTDFNHGFSRCDRYVENAGRLILINEAGDRFPVRDNSAD